mmetsp:Transcript_3262/g.4399  ORF Transcript_3262/g.4399 Transcript_3262/m.4399 type:complete len:337 (-) Transcript_3262:258-1268(-)
MRSRPQTSPFPSDGAKPPKLPLTHARENTSIPKLGKTYQKPGKRNRHVPLLIVCGCAVFALLLSMQLSFLYLSYNKKTKETKPRKTSTTSVFHGNSHLLSKHLREDYEAKLALMEAEQYRYSSHKMQNELGCYDDETRLHRPVYDSTTYTILRQAYENVVGGEHSTIGDVFDVEHTGFRVPYIAKESPGKGRGIFAAADIPKGTVVYDFARSAQFWDDKQYRAYLRLIPSNFACDILMWAYVQDFAEDESEELGEGLRVVVDLDEGALCNNGGRKHGNLGWTSDSDKYHPVPLEDASRTYTKRSHPFVALRDIKAGEEFLCLYDQFFVGHWDLLGL